jgi:hypothetical protein
MLCLFWLSLVAIIAFADWRCTTNIKAQSDVQHMLPCESHSTLPVWGTSGVT